MNDETEDLHEYRQLLQDPHVGIVETTWKWKTATLNKAVLPAATV